MSNQQSPYCSAEIWRGGAKGLLHTRGTGKTGRDDPIRSPKVAIEDDEPDVTEHRWIPLRLSTDRDDYAPSADERSADQNGERGGLAELYSGYDLSQEEKKHHVDAKQFAELPAWGVDHQAISGERQCAAHKGEDAVDSGSAMERRLEARVAVSFQDSGDRQKEEGTAAVRDKLIEQISHRFGLPDTLSGTSASLGLFRF